MQQEQQPLHTKVAQSLQRTIEDILLVDWRTLGIQDITQSAARIRSLKAQYMSTHMKQGLEIQHVILVQMDDVLITLYSLLDLLEGRDVTFQQTLYTTLRQAQTPLLAAYAQLPQSDSAQPIARQTLEIAAVNQDTQKQNSESFQWNQEREQRLNVAIQEMKPQHSTTKALIDAIVQRFNWPHNVVRNKLYPMKLYATHNQQDSSGKQENGEITQEDD